MSRERAWSLPPAGGALVLGADYRALGIVRSLGRRGIPVWVLRHGDDRLAGLSRYAHRTIRFAEPDDAAPALLDLCGRHGLEGWVLYPTADETAATVARHHAALARHFRLTTPPWEVLRWAYDKRLTHRLAVESGLDYPQTAYPATREALSEVKIPFPVVIKPAFKEGFNPFTAAKAWRADNARELAERYDEACRHVDPALVMVQELVTGNGDSQLSYAALTRSGVPLASLVARRVRQYPMDFGRASTFVETVDEPEAVELAQRVLAQASFSGLVEVEFKREARDGRLKLLDINARVWGWHTLCARAGVDFPWLQWQLANGASVTARPARSGVRWMRLSTDLPTAAGEILARRLSPRAYLTSLRGPRESAIFARDDPAPGLAELPLMAYVLGRRLVRGEGV